MYVMIDFGPEKYIRESILTAKPGTQFPDD